MADLLAKHLEKKGKEHSALEMLANQWGFDQQLIPKALQSIGGLFPHYSRHDESHSKQILINIERLLGDNIELLTATDTWLLLEAAYWHDIGMVVPQSDIENALKSEDFQQYIQSIRNAPRHELHDFCRHFDISDTAQCFSGADSPVDAVDKFRQLMAEWFRRRHPQRANAIVQSPWDSVGISSPRTELIPARLFRLLGNICQMHGASFSDLLKEGGLPFREAGLAQEDCHPRFVACLLRMGDLLDLDNNRFCPVMQRIAGDGRSQLSKAHEDKHSSIRHLRIDREYIEIDAECESIDGYVEAFKWFDWLKQEMQDQMSNWQRIVPSRELGLLPTLGDITVRLRGELQILSEGDRPQFTIDADRAKDLLQGSNLYNDKYACIRELLQNAVDATLLRLWVSNSFEREAGEWQTPFSEVAKKLLSSASVKVDLHEESESPDDSSSNWTLTITDAGTGISRADLIHMLKIGGSQRNLERQAMIASMPEWMKPSGVFGIGFQSAFLICDKVSIVTKSIFSSETLSIVMHSPTKDKEGLVLLKRIERDFSQPYGTKIVLSFALDNARYAYADRESGNEIAQQFAMSFDPVLDEKISMSAAKLADKIFNFAQNSPIHLHGEMITVNGKHRISLERQAPVKEPLGGWRFLKLGDHQIKMRYRPTDDDSDKNTFYYRGQSFKANINIPYGKVEVDIMSGRAGSWLNASRDAIAAKAYWEFHDLVLSALAKLVADDIRNPQGCEWMAKGNRPQFSFFLRAMTREYGEDTWEDLASQLGDVWCDLISPDGVNSIRYYLGKASLVVGVGAYNPEADNKNGKYNLRLKNVLGDLFIREWLKKHQHSVSAIGSKEILFPWSSYERFYSLKSVPQAPYDELALATHLAQLASSTYTNSRYILHAYDDTWSQLFLQDDLEIRARDVFDYCPEGGGKILLPYLYRAHRNDYNCSIDVPSLTALCEWVRPRLKNPSSIDEIKKCYEKLIAYIDEEVMKKSSYEEAWAEFRKLPRPSKRPRRAAK